MKQGMQRVEKLCVYKAHFLLVRKTCIQPRSEKATQAPKRPSEINFPLKVLSSAIGTTLSTKISIEIEKEK